MKVKDMIELLMGCNPEADITSLECRLFQKEHYYPISVKYCVVDDNLNSVEVDPKDANVVFVY